MFTILKNRLTIKNVLLVIYLFSLLILAKNLRVFSYASVPLPGETRDEYSFGWLGISLLRDGYPTAWSGICGYKTYDNQKINVDGIFTNHPEQPAFTINKPWFDHPPFFGLLVGGYAYVKGVRDFKDASVIILRRPMIIIGVISVLFVFLITYELFGVIVAIISSLIYTTSPAVVISSRLALAENAYLLLFLISIYLSLLYLKKKSIYYWIMASVVAGIAVLFKLSALSIGIYLFIFALYLDDKAKKKLIVTVAVALVICLLAFLLYGAYYDLQTFLAVMKSNSNRFFGVGAEIFYNAFSQTKITGSKYLSDGWINIAWISFFVYAFSERNNKTKVVIPIIATFAYLLVFFIWGSEAYGWYRYPLYPFLIIITGKVIYDLIRKPTFLCFLLFLLPFGTAIHRLIGVEGFQQYINVFRVTAVGSFLLFVIAPLLKQHTLVLRRIALVAFFVFLIILSIKEVYFYNVGKWIFAT